MRVDNKTYTRAEILQRVGSVAQLGGTRHYTLSDGRSNGVRAIDFDTGSGLRFSVLPDRGLDISLASYKGINLVHLTANGEVHPSFYEPQALGWLRNFFAGLLTTCGLTYLGPPCEDAGEQLGLHGRYTNSPACRVCDLSGWDGDEYQLKVQGVVEESALFGNKIRLTRTITSRMGSKSMVVHDIAENFGYSTSPFTILYHINAGFPLLDEGSELVISAKESLPCDERSKAGVNEMLKFSSPADGFEEQNFSHVMGSDKEGIAFAGMVNPSLAGGLGLYLKFSSDTLPYLNEWKMMGQGDYIVGIEPCNAPCESRHQLRKCGQLPFIEPGETREMTVEIGLLDGPWEIGAFKQQIRHIEK